MLGFYRVNSFLLLLQRKILTKEISKISLKQSSEEKFHVTFCIALMHSSETQIKLLFRGTSEFVLFNSSGKSPSFFVTFYVYFIYCHLKPSFLICRSHDTLCEALSCPCSLLRLQPALKISFNSNHLQSQTLKICGILPQTTLPCTARWSAHCRA